MTRAVFPHSLEGRRPHILILKEAKAEYAKLQLRRSDHTRPARTKIVNCCNQAITRFEVIE